MIQYDELPFLTEDKTPEEISLLYEDFDDARIIFRESCKAFIDDFVPDWAYEEEPFDCDLFIDCCVNEIGKPLFVANIIGIFRDENRNLVFVIDKDEQQYINYFREQELLQIVEQLSES